MPYYDMLRHCLYIGLISICLIWQRGSAEAATSAPSGATVTTPNVSSPGSTLFPGSSTLSSPAKTPLPAGAASSGDANESKRFYTITASLREIYDTNIYTSNTNPVGSFETQISPSILFDFPMENSDFSARETFSALYYSNRPANPWDFTNEVVAQFQHSFSDRFSLNLAEQFRYYTEPSLFENTGTLYQSGAYISNTFNGSFNAQWTPLVSTLVTYANTIVDYQNAATAVGQNSVENTGSGTIGFAILPKITLDFGGIVDDIAYDQVSRGYTSLTGITGINWQALPSLALSGSVGGSVTDTEQASTSTTPYGALTLNWQLGARSSLSFNYAHEVVPTDVTQADGQVADRFGTLFRYDIIPDLSVHLEGTFTHGNYTSALISPNTVPGFTENDFAIDVGLTYHINSHFDVNLGNIYSGVSSGESYRDYNRDQIYLGVRGIY